MTKRLNFPKIPLSQAAPQLLLLDTPRPPVVLVVDDEAMVADTVVAILQKHCYAASAAYSAEEALETVKVIPPDYLITDIVMPGMSGIDLAITVRESIPDCKVLLFSGYAQTSYLSDDPRRVQYNLPLLTKPIHPEDLLLCLSSLGTPASSKWLHHDPQLPHPATPVARTKPTDSAAGPRLVPRPSSAHS